MTLSMGGWGSTLLPHIITYLGASTEYMKHESSSEAPILQFKNSPSQVPYNGVSIVSISIL